MRILRAYYRWNLDLFDALKTVLQHHRLSIVALGAAAIVLLAVLGAPWWLLLAEAATFGALLTWDA